MKGVIGKKVVYFFYYFRKKLTVVVLTFSKKKCILIGMKPYEHIKEFSMKYCDVDFKDEAKLSTILAYLEEVACSSADELGFGYSFVKPRGYAFMVTNICCEFLRPIPLGETVLVKTWPNPPSHVIFGREYQILAPSGRLYMNASSRWCLVDMQTGKLLQSKVIDNQDYASYNPAKALENVRWKLPALKREDAELKFTITIANSEYDHNMHVNNTRYADYFLNCFSVAELAARKLKRALISYVRQCREGETLRFYRQRQEDGSYLICGFNEADEVVAQASVAFEE